MPQKVGDTIVVASEENITSAPQEVKKPSRPFSLIENYIYLYHTDTFIILPVYPESVSDSMGVTFSPTTPLSRSAPLYSYQNSGPRTVMFNFTLHRDMMAQVNYQKSNVAVAIGDDYVDTLIKQLQAAALPKYRASAKLVDPPIVAIRLGNDIFCKGIVNGGVNITYRAPIIRDANGNDKYSLVDISLSINEVDPYDASSVMQMGSFRGLSPTLERNLWKASTSAETTTSEVIV